MAAQRFDPLTYALITLVTVIIWYGAAGATRTAGQATVTITFEIPGGDDWWVDPPTRAGVEVEIEGSRLAVRDAQAQLNQLVITPMHTSGRETVRLLPLIANHPAFVNAGVTVTQVTPAEIPVEVEALVEERAQISRTLPVSVAIEELKTDPAFVMVSMPKRIRTDWPETLTVEPVLSDTDLRALQPGQRRQLTNVPLRLTGSTELPRGSRLSPPVASVSLRVRSQITEYTIEHPVRIQLQAPPEDSGSVQLEPVQLTDVRVRGPEELINSIRRNETLVVAVVLLKATEREARLDEKRVSHFLAIRPNGTSVSIEGFVGERREPRPEVTITYPNAVE